MISVGHGRASCMMGGKVNCTGLNSCHPANRSLVREVVLRERNCARLVRIHWRLSMCVRIKQGGKLPGNERHHELTSGAGSPRSATDEV